MGGGFGDGSTKVIYVIFIYFILFYLLYIKLRRRENNIYIKKNNIRKNIQSYFCLSLQVLDIVLR